MRSNDELKEENPKLYKVAREGNTEAPNKGKYVHTDRDGNYHCAVCDAKLFSSDTKFDSKSGWPSFTDPVNASAVSLHGYDALFMKQTEVRCSECDAHLGHVFPDGPEKNGATCDRYCINSISLNLKEDE